jgi:23S rRNA (cytidine1920-2'-O)/16S rRNA (cytidine1409-2'-O)-methyltransferase
LARSREQARAFIEEGKVLVRGSVAVKAAHLVAPGDPVVVVGPGPRYVSRGGDKLDAALEQFAVAVTGRLTLDAGASTGGFTDCLLQRGAMSVLAVDVGRGQLHPRLRADARVTVLERTNIRNLTAEQAGGRFGLVVADLSFIGLDTVLDALVELAEPAGDLVLLVKPQFEAGRAEAAKGRGVIADPTVWRRVLEEIRDALGRRGAAMMGCMVSPLRGADGNVEFLVHAVTPPAPPAGVGAGELDAVVAAASGDS